MNFPEKLMHLIKAKNKSDSELISALDITYETLEHWKAGTETPVISQIKLLSDYFNVTTDYLLKEEITRVSTRTQAQDFYDKVRVAAIYIVAVPCIVCFACNFLLFSVIYGWAASTERHGVFDFVGILSEYSGIREIFAPMAVCFIAVLLLFVIRKRIIMPEGSKITFFEKLEKLCDEREINRDKFITEENFKEAILPASETVIEISQCFGVSTDYLLRDEISRIYIEYPSDRKNAAAYIFSVLVTVAAGISAFVCFVKGITIWLFYQGEFFISQPAYPQYIAPAFEKYLPEAGAFATITVLFLFVSSAIRKRNSRQGTGT